MFQKKNLKLGALKVRIPYSKCEQLLICSFKDNLIRKWLHFGSTKPVARCFDKVFQNIITVFLSQNVCLAVCLLSFIIAKYKAIIAAQVNNKYDPFFWGLP